MEPEETYHLASQYFYIDYDREPAEIITTLTRRTRTPARGAVGFRTLPATPDRGESSHSYMKYMRTLMRRNARSGSGKRAPCYLLE